MKERNFIAKHNSLLRTITFLAGAGLIIIAGLLFVVLVDLKVKANTNKDSIFISAWLFFAIIFAVGGGIFYFVGDANKHKHVRTLIFKGVGIGLSAFFIQFLNAFSTKINGMVGVSKKIVALANTTVSVTLIITIVALVLLVANYVLSILFIEEDY